MQPSLLSTEIGQQLPYFLHVGRATNQGWSLSPPAEHVQLVPGGSRWLQRPLVSSSGVEHSRQLARSVGASASAHPSLSLSPAPGGCPAPPAESRYPTIDNHSPPPCLISSHHRLISSSNYANDRGSAWQPPSPGCCPACIIILY